jgi:hypothetical protein
MWPLIVILIVHIFDLERGTASSKYLLHTVAAVGTVFTRNRYSNTRSVLLTLLTVLPTTSTKLPTATEISVVSVVWHSSYDTSSNHQPLLQF